MFCPHSPSPLGVLGALAVNVSGTRTDGRSTPPPLLCALCVSAVGFSGARPRAKPDEPTPIDEMFVEEPPKVSGIGTRRLWYRRRNDDPNVGRDRAPGVRGLQEE